MQDWWEELPNERYWCEVTDRQDVGADLKAPTHDEAGRQYWSYNLIKDVHSGDIVFHYSTNDKAFIGASVAGSPMEERPIVWSPHGTSGRSKKKGPSQRSGLWRPLFGYVSATNPLTLAELNTPNELKWISAWAKRQADAGFPSRIPFQCRTDGLRAGQGYLFKMPSDCVSRWSKLEALTKTLDNLHELLSEVDESVSPSVSMKKDFRFKNESDYEVQIKSEKQRRTRRHEYLVRVVGESMALRGAKVSTPHPIDLCETEPAVVIFEVKTTHTKSTLKAVREAVGQLLEYRYFIGPRNAELAVLIEGVPSREVLDYVEDELGLLLVWWQDDVVYGLRASKVLPGIVTNASVETVS